MKRRGRRPASAMLTRRKNRTAAEELSATRDFMSERLKHTHATRAGLEVNSSSNPVLQLVYGGNPDISHLHSHVQPAIGKKRPSVIRPSSATVRPGHVMQREPVQPAKSVRVPSRPSSASSTTVSKAAKEKVVKQLSSEMRVVNKLTNGFAEQACLHQLDHTIAEHLIRAERGRDTLQYEVNVLSRQTAEHHHHVPWEVHERALKENYKLTDYLQNVALVKLNAKDAHQQSELQRLKNKIAKMESFRKDVKQQATTIKQLKEQIANQQEAEIQLNESLQQAKHAASTFEQQLESVRATLSWRVQDIQRLELEAKQALKEKGVNAMHHAMTLEHEATRLTKELTDNFERELLAERTRYATLSSKLTRTEAKLAEKESALKGLPKLREQLETTEHDLAESQNNLTGLRIAHTHIQALYAQADERANNAQTKLEQTEISTIQEKLTMTEKVRDLQKTLLKTQEEVHEAKSFVAKESAAKTVALNKLNVLEEKRAVMHADMTRTFNAQNMHLVQKAKKHDVLLPKYQAIVLKCNASQEQVSKYARMMPQMKKKEQELKDAGEKDKKKIEELTTKNDHLQRLYDHSHMHSARNKRDTAALRIDNIMLNKKRSLLESLNQRHINEKRTFERKIFDLRAEIGELRAEQDTQHEAKLKLEQRVEMLSIYQTETKNKLKELESVKHDYDVQKFRIEHYELRESALREEIDASRAEYGKSQAAIADVYLSLQDMYSKLEHKLTGFDTNADIEKMVRDLSGLQAKIEDSESKITIHREHIVKMQNDGARMERLQAAAFALKTEHAIETKMLKAELSLVQRNMNDLSQFMDDVTLENSRLKRNLELAEAGVGSLRRELVTADETIKRNHEHHQEVIGELQLGVDTTVKNFEQHIKLLQEEHESTLKEYGKYQEGLRKNNKELTEIVTKTSAEVRELTLRLEEQDTNHHTEKREHEIASQKHKQTAEALKSARARHITTRFHLQSIAKKLAQERERNEFRREAKLMAAEKLETFWLPTVGLYCTARGDAVTVSEVTPLGSADLVGICVHDVLLQVNEDPILTVDDVKRLELQAKAGDVWFLLLKRGYKQHMMKKMPIVAKGVAFSRLKTLHAVASHHDDHLAAVYDHHEHDLLQNRRAERVEALVKEVLLNPVDDEVKDQSNV